ncbi:MAG: hypothetical protein ACK5AY_06025 [Bacteroidota bacterium]
MRKIFIFCSLLSITFVFSQNVGINSSGAAPAASAMLDVSSTTSGILIPRMTTAQRTAIVTPASGLLVYDTSIGLFYYYNGTAWVPILANPSSTNGGWSLTGNAGTNGGTISTAGSNYLGTTDAQNLCFRANNIELMRLTPAGEFLVGTYNTATAGDLLSAVSKTTFPWAVNGYSGFNGSGVYGQITGGNTIFAGVQGEYYGTNSQGAGVRGLIGNATAGTSFAVSVNGVSGAGGTSVTTAGSYKFGVYGSGGESIRSGGVLGYDYGICGGLGYYASNLLDYAVYGFGLGYTIGGAGGRYAQGAEQDYSEMSNFIGLGIYGGVMGGWIKGLVYGTNFSGKKYGVYVHGNTVTNSQYVQLNETEGTDIRVPSYATTALTNELTSKGKINLVNGTAYVQLDEKLVNLCDENSIVITATPYGNCNGVFVEQSSPNGFQIKELDNGTSNVSVSFIISATIKNKKEFAESEILNKQYEYNMNGVMHNEYDKEHDGTPIWYDGVRVRHDAIDPSIKRNASERYNKEVSNTLRDRNSVIEKSEKSNKK